MREVGCLKRGVAILSLLLAGCTAGPQSALDPGGSGAHSIHDLLWYFLVPLGIVFGIVLAVALGSLLRRHGGVNTEPFNGIHHPSTETEHTLSRAVGGATILTTIILLGLIVISVATGKAISDRAMPRNPLTIEITAAQWWWNVRYLNDDPSRILVTANEIHIPVGRAILIRGSSLDVIHSFWVPGLEGKCDLIPSRITTEWFRAERPGRYRGQCAEFCGLQHAHMALWVVAEPADRFNEWMTRQLRDAPTPVTASQQRGQRVFLDNACVLCHTIRGTSAAAQVAPDLTHIASRLTIAAGTLANNRGNLAGWIADPQKIKPGNHMAIVPLQSEDMQPLLDYLETLQ